MRDYIYTSLILLMKLKFFRITKPIMNQLGFCRKNVHIAAQILGVFIAIILRERELITETGNK